LKSQMNRVFRIAVSVVFFLWLFPRWMYSCAPEFPYPVFTYKYHPDFPLQNYAAGAIGIPQPTYARSYLVVAYRYFSGVPLDTEEQLAAVQLWKHRIVGWGENDSKSEAVKEWLSARKLVPGVQDQDEIKNGRGLPDYNAYLNCYDDAFHAAATALKTRIRRYGASNSDVRDWLNGQDVVFAYCGEPSPSGEPQNIGAGVTAVPLPEVKDAPVHAPAWLRADRAYQIAAMNFYGGSFDMARQQFERIAADTSSPWNKLAPYLATRCVIRKATLMTAPDQSFDPVGLSDAEVRLNRILQDPRLKSIHDKARVLKGFVEFRLHPAQGTHDFARGLLHPGSFALMREELDNYTQLLDKFLGWIPWGAESDEDIKQQKKFWAKNGEIQQLRRDSLTDWILTFQSGSSNEHRHAIARWRATQSLPWLVSALTHATISDEALPDLLQAASEVPSDSPGYLAVRFHSSRLQVDSDQVEQARKDLDVLLAETSFHTPPSARNQLLALRMSTANSMQEMLQYSLRHPVGVTDDIAPGEVSLDYYNLTAASDDFSGLDQSTPRIMFDRDFGDVWGRKLPLSLSGVLVTDTSLPEELRKPLTLASFTRAVVLKNDSMGKDLAAQLSAFFPETEPYMQEYRAANEAEQAHFAGVFVILHFPALKPYLVTGLGRRVASWDSVKEVSHWGSEPLHSIDDYRDNWWCSFVDENDLQKPQFDQMEESYLTEEVAAHPEESRFLHHVKKSRLQKPEYPLFLTDEEKSQAAADWSAVKAASPSANYLSKEVLAWAQRHPDDPRVPEALHLAVRAARYGCNDRQTWQLTRACFRYLHQHYPNSEWAKKTPVWSY
jgi:hypothetical protein